ncbi:MAG: chemotaxis protein CheD [Thermoguttaceae bacterium]|nr:chemotaxis protein CheD [Thermoguttaceae bacterium]
MSQSTLLETAQPIAVGMGQIRVAHGPAVLGAVLGSCVGVALFAPRLRIGALGHIVLPDSKGQPASPGKFADTAIPAMLHELQALGVHPSGLVAKIVGGACMFAMSGPLQIGAANIEAAVRILGNAGIAVAARDVGGTKGRRVRLDCTTGMLEIEIVGCPPQQL